MVAPSLARSSPSAAPMSLLDFFKVMEKPADSIAKVIPKPAPNPNVKFVLACFPRTRNGDFITGKKFLVTETVKSGLGPYYENGPLLALLSNGPHIEIMETTTFGEIAEDGSAWIGPDLHRQKCKPKK